MSYQVVLQPFGVEFSCEEDDTVLEAAMKAGINLRHGCKHGGCGACKVEVVEGYVEHNDHATAISEQEVDSDIALLCCALPEEDIVIQLDDDYTEAELTPKYPVGEHNTQLSELNWVTEDIAHLILRCEEPGSLGFDPGQYLEIAQMGDEQWRPFSMANTTNEDGIIELMVKRIPGGHFGDYLFQSAKPGDSLNVRGPFGQFGLAETQAPIVMIAGGSGMAPILSLLRQLAAENSERDILFFYGARTVQDLFYLAEIEALAAQLTSFEFIPALSEEANAQWQGERGLITEVVNRRTPESLRSAEGYLCGPPGMIDAAIETLTAKGMFSTRIRFDKFLSPGQ